MRIDFETSANCGGENASVQSGYASRLVCLTAPSRLTIRMSGNVETHNAGYELADARVDGGIICAGGSYGELGECAMREANADGSIELDVGNHLIELSASTVDELYHTGAYPHQRGIVIAGGGLKYFPSVWVARSFSGLLQASHRSIDSQRTSCSVH
jgi:hypothetical protein